MYRSLLVNTSQVDMFTGQKLYRNYAMFSANPQGYYGGKVGMSKKGTDSGEIGKDTSSNLENE